jgi:hypothetical protein
MLVKPAQDVCRMGRRYRSPENIIIPGKGEQNLLSAWISSGSRSRCGIFKLLRFDDGLKAMPGFLGELERG